jgi:hypothetical protein
MPKAYNPKAVNPKIHSKFGDGPAIVSKSIEQNRVEFLKIFDHGPAQPMPMIPYKEIAKRLERGEGHLLGHYASEMTYDLFPGMEDELMVGAWDTHGHVYPDYVPRRIDIIDFAIEASKAKMGGIVCKDHFFPTVGQAWATQWIIDEMVRKGELEYGCKVFGTHILAWSLHPDQINLIRNYPNLGAVFFPTWTGRACGEKIPIIDGNGNLMPNAKECIDLCAEYKIPIKTGHRWYVETLAIVKEATKVGGHVLVTHAEHMSGQLEQSKELAEMGAQMEMNAAHAIPGLIMPTADPNYFPEFMEYVGPEHCHINTDWGQPIAMDPVDGLRLFIRMLMHWGFKKEQIRTMCHTNPEKFLYLQE